MRCPGCAEAMTPHALEECEVDVCTSCGGLWIDWFDGEVRRVTTDALDAELPASEAPPIRNEPAAAGACPRCTRQLTRERYAIDGQATGADLLRCEECLGAFVSRSAAEVLVALVPAEDPPPAKPAAERSPLERLLAALARFFGRA